MAPLNVGCHVSLGRTVRPVVERAAREGFTCLQIFASSPGAWKAPVVLSERASGVSEAVTAFSLRPLIIHAIYLINLASPERVLLEKARTSLIATLAAADSMGASCVVTHIGSHGGRGFEAVAEGIAEQLVAICDSAPGGALLAIESSAGSGGIIGADLAEIGALFALSNQHPRLRLALDTAHLCGSGWDFRRDGEVDRLISAVDMQIGLDRLSVVHANDSRVPCGSRKDRHETVGDGHIGRDGFKNLLSVPALTAVPWILETPAMERRPEELRLLRALHREVCGPTDGPAT